MLRFMQERRFYSADDMARMTPDERAAVIDCAESSAAASNSVARAYYFADTNDVDADGLLDWFEWRYFGSLGNSSASDNDADGFALSEEYVRGNHPLLADTIRDGSVSRRRSAAFYLDLQPYERTEFVLMNGILTNLFSAAPPVPGGVAFGTDPAPAFGDWDGDGDIDLFVGQVAGTVRVLPVEALGSVFPGMAVPSLPFVAGVVIRTDDGGAAVAALGVARPVVGGWLAEAGGAAVLFTA